MMEQVIIECPQCKSVLKVTNTAGSRERTVKCPKCQTPITVQFGDAPANATYQPSPSSTLTGTPQKNHKGLIAALVAVILILAGVVIGLLVSKKLRRRLTTCSKCLKATTRAEAKKTGIVLTTSITTTLN